MKKILLAVTAALAITGCSQNEEFESTGLKSEDVYKRQDDNIAVITASGTAEKKKDVYNMALKSIFNAIFPVSYTHLSTHNLQMW